LIFLLGWQFAPPSLLDPELFSRPVDVIRAWWSMASTGTLGNDLRVTGVEFIGGYAAGALLAVLFACLLTLSTLTYKLAEPYILALYGIPIVALGPLLIVWFGTGITSKIVLAAQGTFTIVLVNTAAGIRTAEPRTIALMQLMGAHSAAIYRRLILPTALPFIVAALRVGIAGATVGVVLGELLGASAGLGHALQEQASFFAVDQMMASVVTIAIGVFLFRLVLLPLERWIERYQPKYRGEK
jgi:sulfonate transport system permease protein